jgi:hypothetical protein
MISGDQLKNKQINSKVETMMQLESAVKVEPFVGKGISWNAIKLATFSR